MKTLAIAQARMGSTRAPGKVMRNLAGQPVLQWVVDALRAAPGVDEVVIATSTLPTDEIIEQYCLDNYIECFRGSETDVLDRFYQCAKLLGADIVLRATCDCPFLDPNVVGEVIKLREITNADFSSNTNPPSYPDGLDIECFTFAALEEAAQIATRSTDRDCVTRYILRNRSTFAAVNLTCPLPGLAKERWVLDTEDDYKFCVELTNQSSEIRPFSFLEILSMLDKSPELRQINAGGERNERFNQAISQESVPTRTFERSQRVFRRATETIPFGAQTFSKSYLQFPPDRAPLYLSHGDGAYVFDVDGNDYVDLVNGLLPIVLGYRDPDVDEAIRRQLDCGISFSLATELEYELSELLCRLIPCAEMVKLGKSGTDVTSASIRLARAYTGRNHIFLSGYHGWADWSMSVSPRNLGIPKDIAELSHHFTYGDREGLLRAIGSLGLFPAAIIVEPEEDAPFLYWLRQFCTERGIILIFDEVITGFRMHLGGAQALYNVTPDLATFAKSMANGMPISALVGKRDIMKKMSPPDNIFYSGTFFGETLSIAAAIATIKKMERENVIEHLWKNGKFLSDYVSKVIRISNLQDVIQIGGQAPRAMLTFKDAGAIKSEQIKAAFIQNMIQCGVLIINANNMSFSHNQSELGRICFAYLEAMRGIRRSLDKSSFDSVVADLAPLRAAR